MTKLKEAYVTEKTLAARTRRWQRLLRPHLSGNRSREFVLKPDSSALLVIDMQRFFLDRKSHAHLPAANAIVSNVQELLATYRHREQPVVFTRHALLRDEDAGIMGRWWGDVPRDGDQLAEIIPALQPLPGELVLRKTRYSPFVGTEFDAMLRACGARQLVVTGVMTHLCCECAARDAFMRDYEVFIVFDATATQCEELHIASLRTLSDGFAMPVTTAEVLRCLHREK